MFHEPLGQRMYWKILEAHSKFLAAGGLQRGLPSQSKNDSTQSLLPMGRLLPSALQTIPLGSELRSCFLYLQD